MYQTIQIKKLSDFLDTPQYERYLDPERAYSTLCIFDIDGVFFTSVLELDTYISNINEKSLEPLREISKSDSGVWIFTDRDKFGFWGNYEKQLELTLAEEDISPSHPDVERSEAEGSIHHFTSSEDFITKYDFSLHRRLIITDAEKPSLYSQNVLKIALMNYRQILYFASQDFPWAYDDKELLEQLSKKEDTSSITFFDVRG